VRATDGMVRAHVNKQGLPPSSFPPPVPASEASNVLVKRSNDGDMGYNPIVGADELEKTLRLSRYDCEDRERESRRGVVWGLVVTGIGEGAIIPESTTTLGSGYLKQTGSLDEVRPEPARRVTIPV
jgi:ATP-dependent Lon protease